MENFTVHPLGCTVAAYTEADSQRNGTWHTRLDGTSGDDKRWAYPDLVARRPCLMLGVNLFVMFALVAIVFVADWAGLSANSDYDWTISDTKGSSMVDAIDLAQISSLNSDAAAASAASSSTDVKVRENMAERNKLFLLFENSAGVFTPTGLKEMCKAEALFIENSQFAAGGVNPDGKTYPGTCLVKPRSDYSVPLHGKFSTDCTVGPIPLVTDLFYPAHNHTCAVTQDTKELLWSDHMDQMGQLSTRKLSYVCPTGGSDHCTLLQPDWVKWRHNQLVCDATRYQADDSDLAALVSAANSFYLPQAGGTRNTGCCDEGGETVSTAANVGNCFELVPLLVSASRSADRTALASAKGLSSPSTALSGITCSSGNLAVLGSGISATTPLKTLCPFACSQHPANDGGSGDTCPAPVSSHMTRDIVYIGWPLPGFQAEPQQGDDQQILYNDFYYDLEGGIFAYFGISVEGASTSSPLRVNAMEGSTQVRWWGFAMQDLEFTRVSYQDLSFTMASILFVWIYIIFHTWSFFLGSLGMFQIIMTLPISLFFYRGIFRISFFNQLHVLAIYLVLGIGADDIFVFIDGWRQSANSYHNTADRLDMCYKRAAYAMGATSSTTVVAFMATAVSPIMPIASFGIYAALGVFFNYVLVMTLFPCVLMVWHKRLYGCCNKLSGRQCCCFQQPYLPPHTVAAQSEPQAAPQAHELEGKGAPREEDLGRVERFFRDTYAPFICDKQVSGAMVSIGLIYVIFSMVNAFQLEPPTEQEQWFPSDHMYQQVADRMGEFMADASDSYIEVRLAFGLSGMNRDGTVFWEPCCLEDGKRGTVEYDSAFSLSTAAEQDFFVATCEALVSQVCAEKGCAQGRLVAPPKEGDWDWCWVKKFKDAYPNAADRTGGAFVNAVTDFRNDNPQLKSSIGMVDGQLKYATISARSTLLQFQPNEITEPVFDAFTAFVDSRMAVAPASLKSMVHSGGVFWTWQFTEKQLTVNVFIGFAICFPCAFLVLVIATRNIIVSSVAIVSVIGIVSSVMGFCKWAMGWGLGIAESIAAVIVIGFSVDYVVHLAHMYMDASHQTPSINSREGRVAYALKTMGVTVISGAVTTFGSGFFLILTQLIFFVKFSSLIMITIGSSIVVALCFFMPALVLIGPEGTTGDLPFIGKFIAAITGGEPPADKEGGHEKLENSEPPKPLPLVAARPANGADEAKARQPGGFDDLDAVSEPYPRTTSGVKWADDYTAANSSGARVIDARVLAPGSPDQGYYSEADTSQIPDPTVAALYGTAASYTPRPTTPSKAVAGSRGSVESTAAYARSLQASRRAFAQYDVNQSGKLSKDETFSMIADMGLTTLSEDYVHGAWSVYDTNHDGELGLDEFARFFTVLLHSHETAQGKGTKSESTANPLSNERTTSYL